MSTKHKRRPILPDDACTCGATRHRDLLRKLGMVQLR